MSEGGVTRLIFENNHQADSSQSLFSPNKLFLTDNANKSAHVYHDSFEEEKKRAFEQGYKEAVAQAQMEWNGKLDVINKLEQALHQPLEDIDQIIQEKSVELAISIAKQIVRRELSLDSGQIVSTVKLAIELIPKDEQHIKQLFSSNEKISKYNIVQDPTISVGGCKASTDYSLVDLTIDKQVANIATQIFGDQRNATR